MARIIEKGGLKILFIDVLNLEDVVWAVCTHSAPIRSITLIDHTRANFLDPMVRSRFDKNAGHTNSCAVIDACYPYALRDSFPKVAESSAEFKNRSKKSGKGS